MSRARHHTSKKHHTREHSELPGSGERGNPNVIAEAKGHTIGTIHGTGAKKRMDRKNGGRNHSDAAEDKAMIREEVKKSALKRAHGGGTGSDVNPYTSAMKGRSGSDIHPYTSAHKRGGKVCG